MQIHDITFSKPCADLEEGVGGVFGLGQIKVEYLHSKITENMPRTLWQTQIFRQNPLPSLQKDSESTHDNSFKFFFQLYNILQFLFHVIVHLHEFHFETPYKGEKCNLRKSIFFIHNTFN